MDISDPEFATKVASLLCSSFPNQAHDAKTFQKQLTIALIGKPKLDLKALTDPRTGYVAKAQFLTIAGVLKWLEDNRPQMRSTAPEHRILLPDNRPPLDPEERERRANMLKALANQLRRSVKHMTVGRPSGVR